MRIAFLTPKMIIGGAETYIITKSRWLVDRGHSVVVISEGGDNVANLPIGVKHIEMATEVSPASFSAKKYKEYIANLSDILMCEHVDIVEAHNIQPIIHAFQSYYITKIPYCINVLNELTYKRNPIVKKITQIIAPLGLLYTLTIQMQAYIKSRVGQQVEATILPIPLRSIDHGVSPHNGHYILSVCRMAADKMYVKHLVKDFIALHQNGDIPDDYRLIVVGDGALYEEVKVLADQKPHVVKMTGTIVGEQLNELYRNAEIYVGTGTTLLLGASCGTPCLIPGFTAASMPYCWGVWGERPQDKDVLAVSELQKYPRSTYYETIVKLINDPNKRTIAGIKARTLFEQYYDSEPIMEQWEIEYQKIIAIFADEKTVQKLSKQSFISNIIIVYRFLWRIIIKLKSNEKII